MRLYTIGFTLKSAEYFFSRLKRAGIRTLVDVRLHNTSQLSGFTKKEDLPFFVREICKAGYLHLPELAPSEELFQARKREKMAWHPYEKRYLNLLRQRGVENALSPEALEGGCLLCTEDDPRHCHRRLAAEYLQEKWPGVEVIHLT
jgi:uncharacterized protein (DUF488 family)